LSSVIVRAEDKLIRSFASSKWNSE